MILTKMMIRILKGAAENRGRCVLTYRQLDAASRLHSEAYGIWIKSEPGIFPDERSQSEFVIWPKGRKALKALSA